MGSRSNSVDLKVTSKQNSKSKLNTTFSTAFVDGVEDDDDHEVSSCGDVVLRV